MEVAAHLAPRFQVWPVARVGDTYSVPFEVLRGVWADICRQRRDSQVFYDGGVTSADEWVLFLHQPTVYPVLVVDSETPRVSLVAWLTDVGGGTAKVHFCGVGPFARAAYRAALRYWDALTDTEGEPLLRVLLGVTPETHEKALRVTTIMGFHRVGTVPNLCNLRHERRRVGGVLSYRERDDG